MTSLFEFDNYKEFIKNYVTSEAAPRGVRTLLAKAIGCQAAYLTQVLNGKADLTEDHAFRLVKYLKLSKLEADYFTLLLRHARAGSPELRQHLNEEIKSLAQKNSEVQSRVLSEAVNDHEEFMRQYFASWIPSTIHMATSSENFRSVKEISQRLSLGEEQVLSVLKFLEAHKLVEKNGTAGWSFVGGPLHLPKNSDLNSNIQIHRRLQVVKSLQQGSADNMHFSSLFTLDKKHLNAIREILLKAVEESHKTIHEGGTDEIYGLCIDLFELI